MTAAHRLTAALVVAVVVGHVILVGHSLYEIAVRVTSQIGI